MTDKTLQDRLRDFDAYFKPGARAALAEKAADALDAQAERIKALDGALREIVKALADSDEEGLIEHAEQMIRARALLGEK